MVKVESKETRHWFIELLENELELGRGLTVILDEHIGILKVVKQITPRVEHRLCVEHFTKL